MWKCFGMYCAAYKWQLIVIANSVYDSFFQRLSLFKMSHSSYCNYFKLIVCSFPTPFPCPNSSLKSHQIHCGSMFLLCPALSNQTYSSFSSCLETLILSMFSQISKVLVNELSTHLKLYSISRPCS